ncbi:MAG: bifunctional YncE family protein/alkaline phosphatase family protein [Ignavibacteriae bacterium]|nr:bifunctional YncE family protein/alkaline phosphatase family protein [Ignavibacteriota bacterium]
MKRVFVICLAFVALSCSQSQKIKILQPPGFDKYCQIVENGESVLPSGRTVTPFGKVSRITNDPFGLTLSPDGSIALAVHDNVLTFIEINSDRIIRLPDYEGKHANPFEGKGSYMGAAILKNNSYAYLSGGDSGDLIYFNLKNLKSEKRISLNGTFNKIKYEDSFVGDIKLSGDNSKLFVLDQFNFRFVIVDLKTEKVILSLKVGRFPLGLEISKDEKFAYVANTGIYDYPLVPELDKKNIEEKGLDFPPYGVPSKEAEHGVTIDGKYIPGLGSPHVPEAVSVWTIDLSTNEIIAKEKTGYRMGEMVEGIEVEGGSSPNSIAAGKEKVFITNATNDNISILNPKTGKIIRIIKLNISKKIDSFRGLIPFGIKLSNDEKKLYVALSGLNAVAVVDAISEKVLGYIPTSWFPTKLEISPDDKSLYVVTARGYGSGPNGGKDFVVPVQGTYVGDIMLGSFEKINLSDVDLSKSTDQVINNTFREIEISDDEKNPLPPLSGLRKSPIKHIVYITKENRTFDEIYGELENAKGDVTIAKYGLNATVSNNDKTITYDKVNIMPNHQKVAREFAVSDNFYCDSDASVHGHRWMVGTYPNEWVELNSSMKISQNLFSSAPGRKFVSGASGAVYPEDYNEAGGMWEHLARHGINFFNFGLGFEFTGAEEEQWHKYSGVKMGVIFPLPLPLYNRTSRKYATYNTSIPDQFRIDMFEEELEDKWLSGKEEFPSLITMMIPNDHMSGERPHDGYPYRQSYLADNDLALGRVLQKLSHTKWWKEMLIIVTEDDAQAGVDHVDAHRSLLMMISPWVKRNYVSKSHANFGAILKTIYLILDMPPLNQFDATATLLQDFFTDKPNFTPYKVEMVDKRIFDPQKALDPYDVKFRWESLNESPEIDNEDDFKEGHLNNK